MTYPSERWAALADHVADTMKRLAMSQVDLVHRSGVSAFTVRRIMRGEAGKYREDRLSKISVALGWPGDGIERVLRGEDPATFPATEPPVGDVLAEALAEVAELRRWLSSLDERVTSLERTDDPPAG